MPTGGRSSSAGRVPSPAARTAAGASRGTAVLPPPSIAGKRYRWTWRWRLGARGWRAPASREHRALRGRSRVGRVGSNARSARALSSGFPCGVLTRQSSLVGRPFARVVTRRGRRASPLQCPQFEPGPTQRGDSFPPSMPAVRARRDRRCSARVRRRDAERLARLAQGVPDERGSGMPCSVRSRAARSSGSPGTSTSSQSGPGALPDSPARSSPSRSAKGAAPTSGPGSSARWRWPTSWNGAGVAVQGARRRGRRRRPGGRRTAPRP